MARNIYILEIRSRTASVQQTKSMDSPQPRKMGLQGDRIPSESVPRLRRVSFVRRTGTHLPIESSSPHTYSKPPSDPSYSANYSDLASPYYIYTSHKSEGYRCYPEIYTFSVVCATQRLLSYLGKRTPATNSDRKSADGV